MVMLEKVLFNEESNIREDVANLLVTAFPEDERPPVDIFFKNLEINKEHTRLIAYYDNNTFIGFTYLCFYQDVCYIFFLAVSENYRHQGYGGQIIEDIKVSYPEHVILLCFEEIDPKYDNYVERLQRKNFYYSHGFIDNKLKTNEFGVIFETAFIGKHLIDFATYVEIFVIGFGEFARNHIKPAN